MLVCNANTGPPPFVPLESLAWQDFIGKVTGELAGVFFITQRVLELMRRQGNGQIIYISSAAADFVGRGRISLPTVKSALRPPAQQFSPGPNARTTKTWPRWWP